MKAVILVPFRPDGAERTRNWKYAFKSWPSGLGIYTGDSPGDFERARARNAAAELAGAWDVALFADADIILDSHDQADAAIMRCYRTGAYTVAYSYLHYITEDGMENLFKGLPPSLGDWDESVAHTWECCFAVRRDVWDQVGGFDERFRGYGSQVAAFFYAYATFGGRERIRGSAYHLPHPLVDRSQEENFEANRQLAERYRAAVDDVHAMREILGERR